MSALTTKLGYTFKRQELLELALSHASCHGANNERLEFLGDRIVGMSVAEWLYNTYPKASEGELSRRLAGMVCGETLAAVAEGLDVADHLQVGASETGAQELKKSTLADTFEALIAAVYLDSDMATAKQIVLKHLAPFAEILPLIDPKSALQEHLQAQGEPLPYYAVIDTKGPPHNREFTVVVKTDSLGEAQGMGRSKRAAEQEAAKELMRQVEEAND